MDLNKNNYLCFFFGNSLDLSLTMDFMTIIHLNYTIISSTYKIIRLAILYFISYIV